MRFPCLYKEEGAPSTAREMAKAGRVIEEMTKACVLATEGGLPSASGTRVRLSEGELTVIDGPFTEAKEVI